MTAIFISHSSKDNAWAQRLKAWLEDKQHRSLFLDFDRETGLKRPGLDPLRELALCLAAVLGQDLEAVASRLAAAGRDGGPLQASTDEIRLQAGQPEAAVLLVLDQMEELLGLSEAQACGRFLDVLRRALEHGDGQFLVLATLRSEYLGEVQLLPFLTTPGPLPYREQTLDPVPLDRFDDIIRVPRQRWPQPVEFADRLVQRMIRDTGTRDALPLLAFTLNRLWRDTAARADGSSSLRSIGAWADLRARCGPRRTRRSTYAGARRPNSTASTGCLMKTSVIKKPT